MQQKYRYPSEATWPFVMPLTERSAISCIWLLVAQEVQLKVHRMRIQIPVQPTYWINNIAFLKSLKRA